MEKEWIVTETGKSVYLNCSFGSIAFLIFNVLDNEESRGSLGWKLSQIWLSDAENQ